MNIDELVEEIVSIVQILSQQSMGDLSGDTLSRLVLKLASYKASLGDSVSTAFLSALDAEADYYTARALAYKKLRDAGTNATDSNELKHIETEAALKVWNQARYAHKRLSQLSTDCHDLIDSIRGRLINLQSERSEANVE